MIQAVFFDFNGVIVDDEPLQMKAYQAALSQEGIALTEAEYYGSLGTDDVAFVRLAFERAGRELPEETLRAVVERKAARHRELLGEGVPLFPGVVTFVKALARQYPLGVVSMASRAEIDYALTRANLAGAFTVVVSAEDASACKPDPSCYNCALDQLNRRRAEAQVVPLQAADCLVVEDAPPGVRAARAAGMRALGVANTVAERELREAGAEVVTRSLADWTVDAVRLVFDGR
jgi:HAD superfamily hydrolase (TIGR01509 family)